MTYFQLGSLFGCELNICFEHTLSQRGYVFFVWIIEKIESFQMGKLCNPTLQMQIPAKDDVQNFAINPGLHFFGKL